MAHPGFQRSSSSVRHHAIGLILCEGGKLQNVSLVNTVLNTIVAEEFNNLSAEIESGKDAVKAAAALLEKHMKV